MKRRMFWLHVAVLLCAAALVGRAADQQMVFINLDRAFNEFHKTKLADAQLKEQAEEFNEERRKLIADFEKLQEDFNALRDAAQDTALSETVKSTKRDEAEDKLVELREFENRIRRFDEARRKQLDDQSRRMRKRIVDEILQTAQNYARVQGYQAVIDSSAQSMNGVEVVVYLDSRLDITDQVLDQLNKGQVEAKE